MMMVMNQLANKHDSHLSRLILYAPEQFDLLHNMAT